MSLNLSKDSPSITMGLSYSTLLPSFNTNLIAAGATPTRCVMLDVSGSIEIEYANGTTDTLTLVSGIMHPIFGFTKIISSSLLVSQIHIGY